MFSNFFVALINGYSATGVQRQTCRSAGSAQGHTSRCQLSPDAQSRLSTLLLLLLLHLILVSFPDAAALMFLLLAETLPDMTAGI